MRIQLSDHFTYSKLIRFTLPSIAMMIFTSIYGVIDGFFVSNYVGATPFAALNLIMPFLMVMSAIGFLFGSGGSALVAYTLGTGDRKGANGIFSLIVYLLIAIGLVLSIVGFAIVRPVALAFGATDAMVEYCVTYTRVCAFGLIPFMLQNAFQSFMIVAEKPKLGLYVTVAAGVSNMVLDWLFMGVFGLGIGSAAAASVIGMYVGGVLPLIYFSKKNSSLLKLGKAIKDYSSIAKAALNGSSEFMTNVSMSIVNMLYNFQLMKFAGENGVSAYGIIMYTNFIFVGVFFGYAVGVSPIIGYHYGTGVKKELKNVFSKSLKMIAIAATAMTVFAEVLAKPLAMIFASYDAKLLTITTRAIQIYSLSFLIMGFNIFGSALFTALNDGVVSAAISFFRTLLFQVASVLILPLIFGLDGIWFSVLCAEMLALMITGLCIIKFRKKYEYI
ncbi:MAG: MATE family efflux transporter [Lachnospiraceae bacterium]|nr:MATE family efflux transporter [Lachnospiraceae bacterium]